MVNLPEATKRVMAAGAEVSRFLYAHPEITAHLPQSYRLVILLLDDPEALAWALGWGKVGEGSTVYALVREGRVEGLLTPEGPMALGQVAPAWGRCGSGGGQA